ncbi:type II toxin-antitoxin system Phd/YefM family antitoxin [Ruficoccus amylovorans]|uniref:Antitoxin n=1 Tax=Ruficoccus amylovorans TaxID=1804625 RepID=A0A842HDA0_9BACT|nr:type II toxin-antitoxin system Phd/YefM family antitoxin [Ruficoccus amylovorans]MBC2593524.1 type II toxin-antitoxin system Phd/YefM family antitoxin [Ruficoccus amylovorans]
MRTISANEAKQSLGRVLDTAQVEPVLIQRHNRAAAIVISPDEYDRLRALNLREFDEFCDAIGLRAKEAGLTEDKLQELLSDER